MNEQTSPAPAFDIAAPFVPRAAPAQPSAAPPPAIELAPPFLTRSEVREPPTTTAPGEPSTPAAWPAAAPAEDLMPWETAELAAAPATDSEPAAAAQPAAAEEAAPHSGEPAAAAEEPMPWLMPPAEPDVAAPPAPRADAGFNAFGPSDAGVGAVFPPTVSDVVTRSEAEPVTGIAAAAEAEIPAGGAGQVIDDVATRLERIVASLRGRSAEETLAAWAGSDAADPLELLICGFVLGATQQNRLASRS